MTTTRNDPVYKRAYYLKNRDRILARVQEHRIANLARIAEYRERSGVRIASRAMVRKARLRAEKKGILFHKEWITADRIEHSISVLRGKCRACGVEFDFGRASKGGPRARSATLDRIDNRKGYVKGNVAILCWTCNKAKGVATLDQLRKLVEWLSNHDNA